MRLVKELIITLMFLALYVPVSLAIWYTTGRTANLVIVMFIGLSIITAYIYVEIARYEAKRFLRRRFSRPIQRIYREHNKPETEEEPASCQPDPFLGFRHLFSQDSTPGGGAL